MEIISASDLEKYCYCPLSWSLSRQGEASSPALSDGRQLHGDMGDDLHAIMGKERRAAMYDRVVLWFSMLATFLALIGVFLLTESSPSERWRTLSLLALLWILLALLMLYHTTRSPASRHSRDYEQCMAIFSILSMVASLNAVPIFGVTEEEALMYVAAALLLLISACIIMYLSYFSRYSAQSLRDAHGIRGEVRYVGEGRGTSRVLRSERYGLSGRPDYILERDGELVPVEVKTGRTPRGPLFSHILQVAAYCLLLEGSGKVSYGILRYGDVEHEIEYNEELKQLLLSKVDEMRRAMATGEVHRNHERSGKCRSCSRRKVCPERLE